MEWKGDLVQGTGWQDDVLRPRTCMWGGMSGCSCRHKFTENACVIQHTWRHICVLLCENLHARKMLTSIFLPQFFWGGSVKVCIQVSQWYALDSELIMVVSSPKTSIPTIQHTHTNVLCVKRNYTKVVGCRGFNPVTCFSVPGTFVHCASKHV